MENKKIAVIMTAYNEQTEWFRAAIESVLNQTYRELHLYLLLDNPDNQELWQIMQEYAGADNRVSIYRNDTNLGLVASLNKLLQMVTEPYVARMDADDICCPNRMERELDFLEQNQLDFVMTGIDFIRGDVIEPGPDVPTLMPEAFGECEKYGNYATHPTWLLKREVYESLEGYREIRYCEDFDFVLRGLQSGFRLARMQEVLLHYRMRETGISISYAYEQYEKTVCLRKQYESGRPLMEFVPEELNQRKDFSDEQIKQRFQKEKARIDAFAADLYQGRYASCVGKAIKGILGSSMYRKIFFDTLMNNRRTNKIFRKVREA